MAPPRLLALSTPDSRLLTPSCASLASSATSWFWRGRSGVADERSVTIGPIASARRCPTLCRSSDQALEELARESRSRRYAAGQVLWNEGDPGDALLVLEEGQLRVSRFTGAGVEVVLSVVEAPSALGELALLDGAPRDASVTAQRPVTVRLIARSSFLALLRREPVVMEGLLRTLAGMVRAGNVRHVTTVGLDVPGRLAAWLLARARGAATEPAGTARDRDRSQPGRARRRARYDAIDLEPGTQWV